jgi:hypothetical protein
MSLQSLLRFPLAALTVLLVCLNTALVIQNRQLKARGQTAAALLPALGTKISKLDGVGPQGGRVSVLFPTDGPKTVLFVFSTVCHYCELNWSAWHGIVSSLNRRSYRVVYVNIRSSLSSGYLTEHGVYDGTVFSELDPRSVVALNLGITPVTVLLGRDGAVEEAWPGLLEGAELAKVRETLSR